MSRQFLRTLWLVFLVLVPLWLGGRHVSIAAPSRPEDLMEAVKKLMDRGQALYLQRDYEKAAEAFHAAFVVQPYAVFVYNEAVCRQKLGQYERAIKLFERYLAANPDAPDAPRTRKRIEFMKNALAQRAASSDAGKAEEAGTVDAGVQDSGVQDSGADAAKPPPPENPPKEQEEENMKSLVILESEPPGAPVEVFFRPKFCSSSFDLQAPNTCWKKVASGTSPMHLALSVGHYHVLMKPFRDFQKSETDIDVAPGHVHQFKANLRQGEFMAFLRVNTPVQGARVYLDDPPPHKRPPWGITPHEGMVSVGHHQIWVERAGFKPAKREFSLTHGESREEIVELSRIAQGIVRITADAPEVTVYIDEQLVGTVGKGGQLEVRLEQGQHLLEAEADGRKDVEKPLQVSGGRVLPVDLVMVPSVSRRSAWSQAIGSALFLAGGVALGKRADAIYDDLREDQRAGILTGEGDRYTYGKAFAIGSTACFGLSGLFAALSTYNFVKDPTPPSAAHVGAYEEFPDKGDRTGQPSTKNGKRRPAGTKRHSLRVLNPKTRRHAPPTIGIGWSSGSQLGLVLHGSF